MCAQHMYIYAVGAQPSAKLIPGREREPLTRVAAMPAGNKYKDQRDESMKRRETSACGVYARCPARLAGPTFRDVSNGTHEACINAATLGKSRRISKIR